MIFEEFEKFIESEPTEVEWEDDITRKLTSSDTMDFLHDTNDSMLDTIRSLLTGKREEGYQMFFDDVDGDGISERVFALDTDNDGTPDQFFAFLDSDGNGNVDVIHSMLHTDLDHDGTMDSVVMGITDLMHDDRNVISVMADMDGDGVLEAEANYLITAEGRVYMQYEDDYVGICGQYENFDPASANPRYIVGNPTACMDNWHLQETDYSCGLAAQEFTLEELTGQSFEEGHLRQIALEKGWVSEETGTARNDMGRMLEYMGAEVEYTEGNTLSDLRDYLEKGIQPIIAVDADELYSGYDEETFLPGRDANHVIQVIGMDESDPNHPMVIVNDSGVLNGCGAMVSADLLMDAWDDGGYVVAAHM